MSEVVHMAEGTRGTAAERILVVVAHPDDETLGAGATMHRLSKQGAEIHVSILSGNVAVRNLRPDDDSLRNDTLNALEKLGVSSVEFGDFPNIKMNAVPHLDLVQFIESSMDRTKPTSILTHHPYDINDDHRQVSAACQAAARMPQRRGEHNPVRDLIFMEILSSTEWAYGEQQFQPNLFQEVSDEDMSAKLGALHAYRDVMRPHPHPRSPESVNALAVTRGSQCGVARAEAFAIVHELRRDLLQWQ